MNNLHKNQLAFAADLRGDGLANTRDMFANDGLAASRRFNVYRNNMRATLSGALAATFPVVEQLVGRDFFSFVSGTYIRKFPSLSGNLLSFGGALPEFLSDFDAASQLPYLADVARLEMAYHEVFHAAAPPPFVPKSLARIAEIEMPNLHFRIGPASRIVESKYPIFRIWQVNQKNYNGDDTVSLDIGPQSVLVVRPEMEVELWRLNPAEFGMLSALESGSNLGMAVEEIRVYSRDFNLYAFLAKCLSSGALVVSTNRSGQAEERSDQATLRLRRSFAVGPGRVR